VIVLHIESKDDSERYHLQDGYLQVIASSEFPAHIRLLCFLDCHNDATLVSRVGVTNRGFHLPLQEYYERPAHFRDPPLPQRVTKLITFDDEGNPNYDNLVYLHGRTTKLQPAFIMSLARELQHVSQHANHYALWRKNAIIETERDRFGATYRNSLLEREAMLVSRRIASDICGQQVVAEYIERQIESARREAIRWNYQNDWNATLPELQAEMDTEVKNHLLAFPTSSIRAEA
jgi:hypothetical protein